MESPNNISDKSENSGVSKEQIMKLLDDRVEFKLHTAEFHLDIGKIKNKYGIIMGKGKIHAEIE